MYIREGRERYRERARERERAVSYIHLPDHETLLELACPVLRAKKKILLTKQNISD